MRRTSALKRRIDHLLDDITSTRNIILTLTRGYNIPQDPILSQMIEQTLCHGRWSYLPELSRAIEQNTATMRSTPLNTQAPATKLKHSSQSSDTGTESDYGIIPDDVPYLNDRVWTLQEKTVIGARLSCWFMDILLKDSTVAVCLFRGVLNTTSCVCDQSGSSRNDTAAGRATDPKTGKPSTLRHGKIRKGNLGHRPANEDGSWVDMEKEEIPSSEIPLTKLLACPFFKHNVNRYRECRSCPGPGWKSIHRLK